MLPVLLPAVLAAQAAPAAPAGPLHSTVTLLGSLGFVHNVSTFPVTPTGLDRNGLLYNARIMWNPGRRLGAGIEVGHTNVYSQDGTANGQPYHQALDATPILLVFAMSPARNLYVNAGVGPSISTSEATLLGSSASSSAFGSSFMTSLLYLRPVSRKLSLGGELRYLRLASYEDNNLSLSITAGWRLK